MLALWPFVCLGVTQIENAVFFKYFTIKLYNTYDVISWLISDPETSERYQMNGHELFLNLLLLYVNLLICIFMNTNDCSYNCGFFTSYVYSP